MKENFSEQIKAEAFRLWLKANQKKAKLLERAIFSVLLTLGVVLLAATSKEVWDFVTHPLTAFLLSTVIVVVLISFFCLLKTLGTIPEDSLICWLYRRYPPMFIHLALKNLSKQYVKKAEEWSEYGSQLAIYYMLHETARHLVDTRPENYNLYQSPRQMEEQWQTMFGGIIDEIESHLDIEDPYFSTPKEISRRIESVRRVASSFTNTEGRQNLLHELRQLRRMAGTMRFFIQCRLGKLQYSDSKMVIKASDELDEKEGQLKYKPA